MAKVLIVEDDEFLSDLYYHTFVLSGFDVHVAHDGQEGVTKTSEVMPDIIFLDIMMPKMNGLEVLTKLKVDEKTKLIPIIILSNFSNESQRIQAMKMGALTYVIKSEFDPKQIVELARKVLSDTASVA